MRGCRVLVALAGLTAASCALGSGVAPSPPTSSVAAGTTAATTTTVAAGLDAEDRAAAAEVAGDYLGAWEISDWALAARFVLGPPEGFAAAHQAWADGVGASAVAFTVGEVSPADDGAGALVPFTARVVLAAGATWEYTGSVPVVRDGVRWLVDWTPAILYPTLEEGDTLRVARTWPARAAILAVDGRPIVSREAVKVIEVIPGLAGDPGSLAASLEKSAGIPRQEVIGALGAAGVEPSSVVPVGTVPADDYPAVAREIEALPGVRVHDGVESTRLPYPFAEHIIGTTGEITAELLGALGAPYSIGDTVGLSGLERGLETTLAGAPQQEVQRVDHNGQVREVIATFPGTEPEAVTTTLDIDVQQAVEEVIEAAPEPAAIVVVDVATGGIRAAASRPLEEFDRALGGLYPPGSTFKVVTTAALLGKGVTPLQTVDCPDEVTLGGRVFTNAFENGLGQIAFADAFAFSCNTVFAPLAVGMLGPGELAEVAASFGFGVDPDLPIAASTAEFPEPLDDAERAAAAIGQGRVLVSPLHQATVAAAIAGGGWRQPTLIAGDPAELVPLGAEVAADTADLMRRVVAYGTGTAATVAGETVRGKTGSAEYGSGEVLPTHAWFIGYWEGYAFAVLVEGGGSGGAVAAPLAGALVERLVALE